MRWSW
jgi:hypothetical protein